MNLRPIHILRFGFIPMVPALLLAVGTLLLTAPSAAAISLSAQAQARPDGVVLDVRTDAPPAQEVLRTLRNGMRAEVVFTIQIYRRPSGIISLLGDRLVQEVRITREARWDAFGEQYVVSSSLGPEIRTRDVDEFIKSFFRITNFMLPWSFLHGEKRNESGYMMVRLQVRPMKLVSALAILSFLRMEQEISTDWTRIPIPAALGSEGKGR